MTGVKQPKQLINLKRTQFQLQQVSCVTPLRDCSQVVPQWNKRLFKFHRIGCTKCSTSPETIKRKKPHLQAWTCLCCCESSQTLKLRWKGSFWLFSTVATRKDDRSKGSQGTTGAAGLLKRLMNEKANCFALLR